MHFLFHTCYRKYQPLPMSANVQSPAGSSYPDTAATNCLDIEYSQGVPLFPLCLISEDTKSLNLNMFSACNRLDGPILC